MRRDVLFASMAMVVAVLAWSTPLRAQTTTPEDDYKKLIKVNEDIQPLGENPFGENVSLYNGSLSFEQTDVSQPGTGLSIQLTRSFSLRGDYFALAWTENNFSDWELNLPRITTLTSASGTVTDWKVDAVNPYARCSQFNPPPPVAFPRDAGRSDWNPGDWWHGYQLVVPGQGSQELMTRGTGIPAPTMTSGGVAMTFPIATKAHWMVSCLPATANGEPGEAFLAVAPDGTKYWFNWLQYHAEPQMSRGLYANSTPSGLTGGFKGVYRPNLPIGDFLNRRRADMLVTRVEDRFGNWLTYSYSGPNLTTIDASDGRRLALTYYAGTNRVHTAELGPAAGPRRVWTYNYAGAFSFLSQVMQPDNSTWSFDFSNLSIARVSSITTNGSGLCGDVPSPDNTSIVYTGTITHPSGLTGSFMVQPMKHGRSYVSKICWGAPLNETIDYGFALYPNAWYSLTATGKVFTGAGIGTQIWTYDYSPPNQSWVEDCTGGGCASTVWTDVTAPDNRVMRYTFSNKYDATESRLLRTDQYSGGVGSTIARTETDSYATIGGFGTSLSPRTNNAQVDTLAPLNNKVLAQDGDTYTWSAPAFDAYGRATTASRLSSATGQTLVEQTSYLNDLPHWVLGLPTAVVINGKTVSQMDYNLSSVTPLKRYHFGQPLMSYTFNAAGQLASFTDGNTKTTTLGSYKRGIPQAIGFPDGTSMSLMVDDYSQVSSITNQAGNTTSYLYDPIGRIAEVDYPTGDSVAWAKQTFTYTYETWVSHGIEAGHWLRGVFQGPKATYTYFDAMMRPKEVLTRRSSDGGTPITSRTDYDFRGNTIFQSYPADGNLEPSGLSAGITTNYDALSRVISTVQPLEQGILTTTFNYLSGARKQVIDPKGYSTISSYQVFDEPSYENVIQVVAPEGVTQTIDRDIYGSPKSITQGGLSKMMWYDRYHRLCRTKEPESKSEVMDYDAANNLAWSASGQEIADVVDPNNEDKICGRDQVTAGKTTRGYDAMNRVTGIAYPAGTAATAMTYTATGKPLTAVSGTVGWTYGYNKLDLLSGQTLSVDGYNWTIGYGYDVNGVLASTVYPDGKAVAYSPDFLGRPTAAGSYAAGATYYPDGDLKAFTFGSGVPYTTTRNKRNLLETFVYGAASAPVVSEQLAYDGNANITQVTDHTNNGQRNKTLGYDGLNRLTSATADNLWGGTESYTYDTLNNIRTLTTVGVTNTYQYDGNNLLTSVISGASTVLSFVYDNRGNVILRNNVPMVFDEANRLTQITGLDSYLYDAEGRRVKKFPDSGSPTYYAYNQAGQLMWQYDPDTTNATDYIYLGKKMVASALVDTSAFHPSQINVTLTLIGVPTLSADGTTISVTVDIANQGTVTLKSNGRDPVHMGARIFTTAGNDAAVSIPRTNIPDIAPGGHAAVTSTIPASAVIGSGNVIRLVPVQEGVAWFDAWGTTPIEVGPFSACAPASTYLCNTQFALRGTESNLSLTLASAPTLSADGQNLVATVDVQNSGIINISSTGSYPVNLANHFANAAGTITVNDITRAGLPVIPPGGHAPVTINTPVNGGVGSGNRIQFELVQEGMHWFRDYGHPAIGTNSFGDLTVPASSTTGAYSVSWTAVPGTSNYRLDEQVNGGAWTAVQTANSLGWSTSGRTPGTYGYRMAPCGASGCGTPGTVHSIVVSLPPPAPAAISVPASSTGNIAIGWSSALYATSYSLEQNINGGAFGAIYNGAGLSYAYTATVSGTYTYRVRACNATGCSGYGPSKSSSIVVPPQSAPGISAPATNNIGIYTVSWTGVSGAATYLIQEQVNGGGFTTLQNSATTSIGRSGKVNGTYGYRVQACNASGCGPFSGTANVVVALVPHVPATLTLTLLSPPSKGRIQAVWSAVTDVTRYEVQESIGGGSMNPAYSGTATTMIFTRGSTGLTYVYQARACNANGCSAWGQAESIDTLGSP
ncbi:hypothetical protein [Pinirhizobacter sp.]|jgi:YD repeat-containing protein|uniref:hypothetical protein n=1 Tax=Pinirhizobacter sp. TaxID=2950432 RepID=UPI002F40BA30